MGSERRRPIGRRKQPGAAAARETPELADVSAIHAGFAIKKDGTVWAWGHNKDGRLADGSTSSRNTPQQVPGLSDIASMASRHSAWFAITRTDSGDGKHVG